MKPSLSRPTSAEPASPAVQPNSAASTPEASAATVACAEVWGGNQSVETEISLPGMRGLVFSRSCEGARGGDLHFISICGSGLMSRICVADVAGHGSTVASVAQSMHRLLRRFVNRADQRRMLVALNRRLVRRGLDALATMVALTYVPPTRTLSFSYAGHPPGWHYSRRSGRWRRLEIAARHDADDDVLRDIPLAVSDEVSFSRGRCVPEAGDRVLIVTDGVLEARDARQDDFGTARLAAVLDTHRAASVSQLTHHILDSVRTHAANARLDHDDVTILLLEFTDPPSNMLGYALRQRVRRHVLEPLRRLLARLGTSLVPRRTRSHSRRSRSARRSAHDRAPAPRHGSTASVGWAT